VDRGEQMRCRRGNWAAVNTTDRAAPRRSRHGRRTSRARGRAAAGGPGRRHVPALAPRTRGVRPLLLPGTRLDSVDGPAYIGLVVLHMRFYGEFLQFKVRTYAVDRRGRRGVVFVAMEANRLPWVLVSRAACPPYRWSRASRIRDVHALDYRLARRWPSPAGIGIRIRVRVRQPIEGNPLDHFAHRPLATPLSGTRSHADGQSHAQPLAAACR
jgi:Uncharacterized conserved protein (COG2071)